jgi:ABC-type multidrug transport system fused ATPase/permease subunit
VLSRSDQKKVSAVILLQVIFSLLDLLGVAFIGMIGALAIRGAGSRQPGDRVGLALRILHLDGMPLQSQVAWLGGLATALLISRTVLSILFTRRTFYFLSRRGASLTTSLFSRLLSQSLMGIQRISNQETLYALTNGVSVIMIGILGSVVNVISDAALLIVLSIGIFIVDPTTALFVFVMFGLMGILMYRSLHGRVRQLGLEDYRLTVASNERILEVLHSYRETVVKNRRSYYANEINEIRQRLANVLAELSFVPYISKYVIETAVVIGAVAIGGFQFLINDAARAVATLTIFLAAGTRIAPAVLRVQQGAILIRGNLAVASPTLDLIESLNELPSNSTSPAPIQTVHSGFIPKVSLEKVSFSYPNSSRLALNNINLEINPGESVVLVGPSGAGKTTIVDVLLGVIEPNVGTITISGKKPGETVTNWSGAIAYVPQDVVITNSTIRENICMGFDSSKVEESLIWDALEVSQLKDFVKELPLGLDTYVGDRGAQISGGQRQRLGIARAMLTKPQLLVLDEATSSLDGETEANISQAIRAFKGKITVVMIAHRLSSVRDSDKIVYMDNGEIRAIGDFDTVRKLVKDFDNQASLMGL